jgi:hypothetical protein
LLPELNAGAGGTVAGVAGAAGVEMVLIRVGTVAEKPVNHLLDGQMAINFTKLTEKP